MVNVTYQMVLSTLQTVSIMIGIVYYLSILRNTQKTRELTLKAQEQAAETRQAQLFMQMYNRWNTLEMRTQFDIVMASEWKDYDGYVEYSKDKEYMTCFNVIATFIEGIGVLVHRGLIEAAFVDDLMSGSMMRYWEKIEPIVYGIRLRRNWPQYAEWIEYLYYQIKPIY